MLIGYSPRVVAAAFCCAVLASASVLGSGGADRQVIEVDALPLAFAQRCSVTDGHAAFVARGHGYHLEIGGSEAYVGLVRPNPGDLGAATFSLKVIGLRFEGANVEAKAYATHAVPAAVHHFHPESAQREECDAAFYRRVRFEAVYDGIDIVYYGTGRELEFDFVVHPGADPASIRLAIDNAETISIDADGALNIGIGRDTLVLRRPIAYQQRESGRDVIPTRFAIDDSGLVRLSLGDFDSSRALVVDPVLSYATYLGGTKTDYGTALAVDAAGNAYVAGYTTSPDFPMLSAYDKVLGANDTDAFVTKFNASGKALVYSTYLGGAGIDRAAAIAVDAAGNAYVTGSTSGGFPTTAGAYQTAATGNASFVAKLGPTGSTLAYSTFVQGVEARAIAVDGAGNAYVTGRVIGPFATTAGAYQQAPGGAFVLKLNATGTAAAYATYLGYGGAEAANAIAVDAALNAYIAGSTDSTIFPVVNALQPANRGGKDGFIARLNASGSALTYSTYLGGAFDDEINGLALDGSGNMYVAGETYSADFPIVNAFMTQKPGAKLTNAVLGSGFFAKLVAGGTALAYSSFLGGEICASTCNLASPPRQYPGDAVYAVTVDDEGHAYLAGLARSYTFPLVNSLKPAKTQDNQDAAFVTKVARGGEALLYSNLIRSGTSEPPNNFTRFPAGAATAVATDDAGAAYVAGDADSASNFTTVNAYQAANGGEQGAIAMKLAGAPGTLTLVSSVAATAVANPVTLTATIAGASLSGTIAFADGAQTIGTAPISGSKAVLTTTFGAGIHRLSAVYGVSGKEIDSPVINVIVDNALTCN